MFPISKSNKRNQLLKGENQIKRYENMKDLTDEINFLSIEKEKLYLDLKNYESIIADLKSIQNINNSIRYGTISGVYTYKSIDGITSYSIFLEDKVGIKKAYSTLEKYTIDMWDRIMNLNNTIEYLIKINNDNKRS